MPFNTILIRNFFCFVKCSSQRTVFVVITLYLTQKKCPVSSRTSFWFWQCLLPRRLPWGWRVLQGLSRYWLTVSRASVYSTEDYSCDRAASDTPCRSRRALSPTTASSPLALQATFPLPRAEHVQYVREWRVLPYISKIRNIVLEKNILRKFMLSASYIYIFFFLQQSSCYASQHQSVTFPLDLYTAYP